MSGAVSRNGAGVLPALVREETQQNWGGKQVSLQRGAASGVFAAQVVRAAQEWTPAPLNRQFSLSHSSVSALDLDEVALLEAPEKEDNALRDALIGALLMKKALKSSNPAQALADLKGTAEMKSLASRLDSLTLHLQSDPKALLQEKKDLKLMIKDLIEEYQEFDAGFAAIKGKDSASLLEYLRQ